MPAGVRNNPSKALHPGEEWDIWFAPADERMEIHP